jgi:hypothetical protein
VSIEKAASEKNSGVFGGSEESIGSFGVQGRVDKLACEEGHSCAGGD